MLKCKNGMFETIIAKEQIDDIRKTAKDGDIKIENWYLHHLYKFSEYYGFEDKSAEEEIIDRIHYEISFGEFAEAQRLLDEQMESVKKCVGGLRVIRNSEACKADPRWRGGNSCIGTCSECRNVIVIDDDEYWQTKYCWESIVELMDDDIREDVHMELAPCHPAFFLREYKARHLEKFGKEFTY